MTKEEYILDRVHLMACGYEKENKIIDPELLLTLINQWGFDYEMNMRYSPSSLKTIQGICRKCSGVIDSTRREGDKPTARIFCKNCS